MKLILGIIFAYFIYDECYGYTYSLRGCPQVEPMANFDMNQMLGLWYVIQKTSTASQCITYNFARTDASDQYEIIKDSQHSVLGLTSLKHTSSTGRLTVPSPCVPSKMIVRFPFSVAGSASYTVLMTDYERYAAIFTCQKLTFAHRESVTILSRGNTLDKLLLDKIRNQLSSLKVDLQNLSNISQNNCRKTETEGAKINIDVVLKVAEKAYDMVSKKDDDEDCDDCGCC